MGRHIITAYGVAYSVEWTQRAAAPAQHGRPKHPMLGCPSQARRRHPLTPSTRPPGKAFPCSFRGQSFAAAGYALRIATVFTVSCGWRPESVRQSLRTHHDTFPLDPTARTIPAKWPTNLVPADASRPPRQILLVTSLVQHGTIISSLCKSQGPPQNLATTSLGGNNKWPCRWILHSRRTRQAGTITRVDGLGGEHNHKQQLSTW